MNWVGSYVGTSPMTPAPWRGAGQGSGCHTRATRMRALLIDGLFMAKIDDFTVLRIKEAAKIEEVVGEFLTLHKRGKEYEGKCPFHNDRHYGNFKVNPKKNIYKCFSCGASGDSIKFLMEDQRMTYRDALVWLAQKYNIFIDEMEKTNYQPPKVIERPAPPPLELLTLPMSMVTAREDVSNDNLVNWIRTLPWDGAQRARIEPMLADYHIGHAKQGLTIFWQIDEKQQVRTGKMMRYKADGHRDKESKYGFDFIHSVLSRHWDAEKGENTYDPPYPYPHIFDPDKQEMVQTLFGMHLLDKYKGNTDQDVCIVESEKTALLMSIAYGNHPQQVWMACGGKENLNRDKLYPIIEQNRHIVLYPDRDGIDDWQEIAKRIDYKRLEVETKPVTEWWQEGDGPKADIADVVIRMLSKK